MTDANRNHYGISQVGKSLRPFFIGKGFKIVSTFAVLILLSRALPHSQFAAYGAMQALIFFGGVFATLGTEQVLVRFIPELRSIGEDRSAYRLLVWGSILRGGTLVVVVFVVWFFQEWISTKLGFVEWQWLLLLALIVGAMRLTSLTISMSMESLLWQREAQYSLATGGVAILIGMSIAYYMGILDLRAALTIELLSEVLIMALLAYRAYNRWKADPDRSQGSEGWLATNRKRIIRFGAWSWLVDLAGSCYGSAPSRLVAATYMPETALAAFNFADRNANLGRRFMPVRLWIGLIRPVFLSKFATTGDFSQLVRLSNMLFRINMVLFAFPIVLLIVAGEPVFAWITAGKYGGAAILLAGFLCLLILEGLKFLYSLLTQAVKKPEIMLMANLVTSASLILSFVLFPLIGGWAVVVASIIGMIVAISSSAFILGREGYPVSMDWKLCSFVVASALIATAAGLGVLRAMDATVWTYVLASAVATLTLIVLMAVVLRPFTAHEITTMKKLLKSGVKGSQPAAAGDL